MPKSSSTLRTALLATVAGSAALLGAGDAHAIVVRADTTPNSARDNNNTWPWVGQMIAWDNRATASFGLCTGQVINPRVVLFAAHCFGGVASGNSERYGTGTGLRDMAFMFNNNNLPALRQWIGFDPSTTAIGASNEANRVYRVIDIIGHPLNANNPFTAGNADVSLAVLDAPIFGFDGYGMLFSPLTALERVELAGYGRTGTMNTGQTIGVDWWRRVGENTIGFLGSDNDVFGAQLFGGTGAPTTDPGYNGDLYWMDSDGHTNPRLPGDFNIFGGAALPNEVGIAQGDSGGAMWIRRNGVPIALGVASYGYSFAGATTSFGRGTITAHTPLFAYWDFIVANNAYVYAAARTGGGAWESGATWQQMLDPNYLTIGANGAVVNALPTTAPVSDQGGAPNVGAVRPPPATPVPNGNNDAPMAAPDRVELATNSGAVSAPVAGEGIVSLGRPGASDFRGAEAVNTTVTLDRYGSGDFSGSQSLSTGVTLSRQSGGDFAGAQALNGADTLARPDAEPASSGFFPIGTAPLSGPGSTNFVPNNTAGTPGTAFQNAARYFEVQLVNSGTVTLSSARTIDRLRIMNGPATLQINSGASLTTIMSSSVEAGRLDVNGTLRARGVGVLGGLLTGTGTVAATGGVGVSGAVQQAGATVINTNGAVAPGGIGTVGTLTFQGNVVFNSTGNLLIDVASGASADQILVRNFAGAATGPNGTLALGGNFAASFLGGFVPDWGTSWVVANAQGEVSGSFAGVTSNLPGVLTARVRTVNQDVVLDITARPYATFGICGTEQCGTVAALMDQTRAGGYAALRDVFRTLDRLPADQLRVVLNDLAPHDTQIAARDLLVRTDVMSRMVTDRVGLVRRSGATGAPGAGLRLVGSALASGPLGSSMGAGAGMGVADGTPVGNNPGWPLKEGWSAFGEVRGIQAEVSASDGFAGSQSDGYAVMAGIDYSTPDGAVVGAALQGAWSDGSLKNARASADSSSIQLTVYGGVGSPDPESGLSLDGYVSFGQAGLDTSRRAGPLAMGGSTEADLFGWGLGAAIRAPFSWGETVLRAAYTSDTADLDGYSETGPAGLTIGARSIESKVMRFTATAYGDFGTPAFRPWVSFGAALDMGSTLDGGSQVTFAASPTTPLAVAGAPGIDGSWNEAGLGFDTEVGRAKLMLGYETTFERDDVQVRMLRARARFDF
jgi:hypothetical protein